MSSIAQAPLIAPNLQFNSLSQQFSSRSLSTSIFSLDKMQKSSKQSSTTFVKTNAYLQGIEEKFTQLDQMKQMRKTQRIQPQQFKTQRVEELASYMTNNESHLLQVPGKFRQKSQNSHMPCQMPEPLKASNFLQPPLPMFGNHIPDNISLSKGVSERNNYSILEEIPNQNQISQQQLMEQKSAFFNLCQQYKANLPQTHSKKNVLVTQLYSEVMQQGINPRQWDWWIKQRLQ